MRYSYRFLFIPGTIGAITWLARNRENAPRIRHGLVLTCIGDKGNFHYKKSRRGNAEIDRAVAHVLSHDPGTPEILDFSPYGYDERQYCSPGFNLPVGCLMRSVWGTFPEYHTSADNLDFIEPLQLAGSWAYAPPFLTCSKTITRIATFSLSASRNWVAVACIARRASTRCRMRLTPDFGFLTKVDGQHTLLDIAERAGLPFATIREAADLLAANELLEVVSENPARDVAARPARNE